MRAKERFYLILIVLLIPLFLFASPVFSQQAQVEQKPAENQTESDQADLTQIIENLTRVAEDLTRATKALTENSGPTQNRSDLVHWLWIVVPIILAIIGAVAWLNKNNGRI